MFTHLGALLYVFGSLVCHQIPERSFHVSGVQLPVCARCTGLYVSGAIGALVALAGVTRGLRPPIARRALILSAIPTLATVATAALGVWDPDNAVRALFAVPLGLSVGAIVAAGLRGHLR